ncbi:hypothetical protein ABZP36_011219 [Zizania latifolia]
MLNNSGSPLRPVEKECSYYMKTGRCKFGSTCKFHHPEFGGVPVTPGTYPPLQSPSIPSLHPYASLANWQMGRPPMVPGSYMPGSYTPMMLSSGLIPLQGWSPYPASVNPVVSAGAQQTVRAGPVYGMEHQGSSSTVAYSGYGGATAEIMCDLLSFEADRRAVNITINRLQVKSQTVQDELARLGEQMVSSAEGTRAVALELCREFEEFISCSCYFCAAASSMSALKQPTIGVVAIIAESVPESDTKQLISYTRANNKVILGPATVGGIQAGAFKIGDTAGTIDSIIQCKLYRPGSVVLYLNQVACEMRCTALPKFDMGGSAAVFGAAKALGQIKPPGVKQDPALSSDAHECCSFLLVSERSHRCAANREKSGREESGSCGPLLHAHLAVRTAAGIFYFSPCGEIVDLRLIKDQKGISKV